MLLAYDVIRSTDSPCICRAVYVRVRCCRAVQILLVCVVKPACIFRFACTVRGQLFPFVEHRNELTVSVMLCRLIKYVTE